MTVVLAFVLVETGLRIATFRTNRGVELADLLLPPTWSEIVDLTERAPSDITAQQRHHVHDLDFVRLTLEQGPTPLLAFMPGRLPFQSAETARTTIDLVERTPIDLTDCVELVSRGRRRVDGNHFTGETNTAIADWLLKPVRAALR